MVGALANPNFFKKKLFGGGSVVSAQPAEKALTKPVSAPAINSDIIGLIDEASEFLYRENLDSFAQGLEEIKKDTKKQTFSVAVVGEFSRGKSTFVNKLFGRDFLPVANMPTTAILTRIKHSERESITVLDTARKKKKILPLSIDSWDEYVASDDGKDPSGVAFVGLNSKWLKSGIEIIDTPGAGDLEASRAAIIGDALRNCDGAIITISATVAMSMSEKLFIEERLLSKKTPFLMLIITKLDQVSKEQRSDVVDFVKAKLQTWNMKNIPVYIPYKMEMPDNKHNSIMGMDKVVTQINSWVVGSNRKKLTEQWIALKVASQLKSVVSFLNEKKCIYEAESDMGRQQLIKQKTEMLSQASLLWEKAKSDMIQKSNDCYVMFEKKLQEEQYAIIEKFQYDISHISNVKKWWDEDYPYRLKLEMTRLATILENIVARQVANDVRVFNMILEKNFKTSVLYTPEEILNKNDYTNFTSNSHLVVKDVGNKRNISRIGVTALSIGSALVLTAAGIPAILGTMGIGTGGSILSETIFKKKTEEQKEILKKEVENSIPVVIKNAMLHSEKRIKKIYNDIISESSNQQENWLASQKKIIESSTQEKVSTDDIKKTNAIIQKAELLIKKAERYA